MSERNQSGISTWGVSSILGEDGQVFYALIQNSIHLGRICDLVSARLRDQDIDELRLRAVCSFGALGGFLSVAEEHPVQLEFGIDNQILALSFKWNANESFDFKSLEDQVLSGKGSEVLSWVVLKLQAISAQVHVKYQNETRFVEIVVCFPKQMSMEFESQPVQFATLAEDTLTDKKASLYVELGDLDFEALLKDRGKKAQTSEVSESSRKVSSPENDVSQEKVVKGGAENLEEVSRVDGDSKEKESKWNVLGKLNPFKKKEDASSEEAGGSTEPAASEKIAEPKKEEDRELEEYLRQSGIGESFEQMVQRVTQAGEKESRGKKWTEGLIAELAQEKTRWIESVRKMGQSFRQKELQLLQSEQALREEIRKRDEVLRQKSSATTRLKDQLTEALLTVERLKLSSQASPELAQVKMKNSQLQQTLSKARDEIMNLNRKIEELRSVNQVSQSRVAGGIKPDVQALQMRLDRANMQLEEFKKLNKSMAEKFSSVERKRSPEGVKLDEIKARLQQAVKIATERKAEADRFKLRIDELEHELKQAKEALAKESIKEGKPAA